MEDTIRSILRKYPSNKKDNLIPILQEIQKEAGYLSKDYLQMVSDYLSIPVNKIFGVATFYDQFRFKPVSDIETIGSAKKINIPVITPEDKIFLIEKILKNITGQYQKEEQEKINYLRREKVTKPVIYIGTGSCGVNSGAYQTLDAVEKYLTINNEKADVFEVGCKGLCSEEPVMDVQLPGKACISFRKVTSEKVENILDAIFHKAINPEDVLGQYPATYFESWANVPDLHTIPWFNLQKREVLRNSGIISPYLISDYLVRGGYKALYKTTLNYIPDKVCEIIEQSELRGRSGSGYLTGKKWKIALNTAGDEKYLICNADESNPDAFIDRAIIEGDPHRLIEGIAIACYAIGANNAFLYIRSNYFRAVEILEEAIRQAKEYEILGSNIFGSGFNLNLHLRLGAGAFVCGEETALIKSIEGKRGMPQTKPPYPAEIGLFGKPTVVNNVETLVNVPGILENGPAWFRSTGSKTSKGTKVVSLKGKIRNEGVIEVPMGMTVKDIIYKIGGGIKEERTCKAVQIGGPLGYCLPESLFDTEIGFESMLEAGAALGSGGLEVLDDTICMVNLARNFMNFLQDESCGKCIPCREGTRRMFETLDSITCRPKEESSHETLERFKGVVQLESLAKVISSTSLCGLGQNAPNPVISSLKWFREEFEEHIFDRRCSAGVCRNLRTFFIDVDACTGCNICQKKCPENVIIGVIKAPHFIVEEKCTGCGECFESCKFNAIFIK